MQEFCPRCDAALPIVDGALSSFCANCGLPQLRVAEEWPVPGDSTASQAGNAVTADSRAIDWPILFRICAIAAVAGLVPSVLLPGALITGNAGSLALFLLPVLCLVCAAVYLHRRPMRHMTAGAGARMGAVLALFLNAGVVGVSAVLGFVLRYGYHSRSIEQNIGLLTQNFELQVRSKAAGPQAEAMLRMIRTPEWHAGMYLSLQLTVACFLLCVGCIFGALAGAMLGARQRRNQAAP